MTTTLNASTAGAGGFIATSDNSGSLALQTAGTTAITIDTSQNVGIGVTSPAYKLDLLGGNTPAQIASNDATASIGITLKYNTSTVYGYLGNGSSILSGAASSDFVMRSQGALAFATNGNSERMRIDSSGNLLVGITALPQTAGGNYGAALRRLTSGSSQTGNLSIGHGDVTGARVASFYYGTTPSLIGSIDCTTTSTAYNTSSDYRLKNSISSMTGALAKVVQLKPVTYKWNSNNSDGEGFIAHELQEVVPGCVTGIKDAVDEDGNPKYQGIDTSFLVATLTAAIQELKAINDTQAETLTQQTEAINALTARIVALESRGTV